VSLYSAATVSTRRWSYPEPVCKPLDEGVADIELRLRDELVGLVRLRDGARAADDGRDAGLLVEPALSDVADFAGAVRSRQLGNERGPLIGTDSKGYLYSLVPTVRVGRSGSGGAVLAPFVAGPLQGADVDRAGAAMTGGFELLASAQINIRSPHNRNAGFHGKEHAASSRRSNRSSAAKRGHGLGLTRLADVA
jgi:hypothetical protein